MSVIVKIASTSAVLEVGRTLKIWSEKSPRLYKKISFGKLSVALYEKIINLTQNTGYVTKKKDAS